MLSLSSSDRSALAAGADTAIRNALMGVTSGWRPGAPKNEPDAVAAVVSIGLPDAARSWSPILRPLGYRAQVTGVFCHSTPKVTFTDVTGTQRTCELADLLVVIDEALGPTVLDRRAVLVQAKVAAWPSKTLTGSDLVQLELYQRWPQFHFRHAPYPANWRDIGAAGSPGSLSDSSDYGAIDLAHSSADWQQVIAQNPLAASGTSLGATLADMAAGLDGRETLPGGADEWSDTIEQLLTTTFVATAGGFPGSPGRGVTTVAFAVQENASFGLGLVHRSGDGTPAALIPGDREDGPMSVIHIRLDANLERR